jgi:hypothetical protein
VEGWYQAFGTVSGGCHQDHHGAPLTDDGPTWWGDRRAGMKKPPRPGAVAAGGSAALKHFLGDLWAKDLDLVNAVAAAEVVNLDKAFCL